MPSEVGARRQGFADLRLANGLPYVLKDQLVNPSTATNMLGDLETVIIADRDSATVECFVVKRAET